MAWFEWWSQLLGTLIGTGVGFALAMWWDRAKERTRVNRERSEMVDSLVFEMQGIRERLDVPALELTPDPNGSGAVAVTMSVPFLSRSAFDAAVYSGNLTLLPSALQADLSTIYEQLRIMRKHADNLAISYARGSTVEEHTAVMQNAANYLSSHADMLKDQLHEACGQLAAVRAA
jgi:hypothetical protein